jgi:hypothetical protein
MSWIQKIRECFESDSVFYTRHASFEMANETVGELVDQDVYEAVCNGEVIEQYPEDKPYPGVLILGRREAERPLHVVCAYNEDEDTAIVITVYHPDPSLMDRA